MSRRGLGMECPEQIVVLLREAGWQGYNVAADEVPDWWNRVPKGRDEPRRAAP